ncbi:Rab3 GTPase-activating protein catalytic subunit-like protein, partial [Dinothrombium tinctorium]
ENDVFEITDYTTASDWERFISDFEEVIRHWNLTSKLIKSNESSKINQDLEQMVEIKFAKVPFSVMLYNSSQNESLESEDEANIKALQELLSVQNDYPSRAHCICRYYGFKQFIVLCPLNDNDSIYTEDKAKLVLSALTIALSNTNCSVPVFLQLHQKPRKFFRGTIVTANTRTDLEMVHFIETPHGYGYLSELLNLFKEKLTCPLESCPPMNVSVRLTHIIRKWPEIWSDDEEIPSDDINLNELNQLKIKCNQEPLLELQLSTTWPSLSEQVVSDSEYYSDLNPLHAPQWTCRLICKEAVSSNLSDALFSFIHIKNSWSEKDTILGKVIISCEEKESELEVKQALNKLANPLSLSLPSFTPKLKLHQSQNLSKEIVSFIFDQNVKKDDKVAELFYDFRSFKSSPYNGLVWRLAVVLCQVYYTYRDLALIAYIWKDLINELRRYWESCSTIEGFDDVNVPNLGTCLLHQKLELLMCCIQQKNKREGRSNQSAEIGRDESVVDDDDIFFDCMEEIEDKGCDNEGEGRLEKHQQLLLLKTGDPLYIPVTQEPTPLTEDMLQEQAQILSQLGTTAESSLLRARMQCANLLSDMEAFKAANPGAILEDFVRWHSPRDYIEEDSKQGSIGHLSTRMQHSGNIWREMWDSARAIPALKQKRIFDYTKEAEKFLHYLASFTLSDLVNHMMPVLIHYALAHLTSIRSELELSDSELPINVIEITHNSCNGYYDRCLKIIQAIETKLLRIISLKKKLEMAHNLEFDASVKPFSWNFVKKFILQLLSEPEVKIPGNGSDYFGALIKRLFMENNALLYEEITPVGERDHQEITNRRTKLPPPMAKEFILRLTIPYPAAYSKPLPQRMYCLLSPSEFRLATAVTEDTIHF